MSIPLGPVSDAYRGQAVPYEVDPAWREKRQSARQKEVLFGVLAYLTWTWEGEGLLLATVFGAIGGWFVLSTLLE